MKQEKIITIILILTLALSIISDVEAAVFYSRTNTKMLNYN